MSGILIETQTDTRKAERDLAALNRQMMTLIRTSNQNNAALQNSLKQDFSQLTQSINSSVKSMMQFQQAGVTANNSVAKSTQATAASFSSLNKVLATTAAAFAAFQGVKVFSQMSDDLTNIQNRLKLVNDEVTELAKTQSTLKKLSVDTRSAFSDVAGLYTDFSLALAKTGESQEKVLKVIKTIQQAGTMSGSSVESLRAGIVQLLQGISSGTIRGEELNSVMEQMKYLSIGLQRELNMTSGQLRKFAEEGNLTTKLFLDTVDKLAESTAKDFAKTSATIAQGGLQLKSSISYLVGNVSAMTGIGVRFANTLLKMADSLNAISDSLDFAGYNLKVFKENSLTLFGNLRSSLKVFSEDILEFLNPTNGFLKAFSLMRALNDIYRISKQKIKIGVDAVLSIDTSYFYELMQNLKGFVRGFINGLELADVFTLRIASSVSSFKIVAKDAATTFVDNFASTVKTQYRIMTSAISSTLSMGSSVARDYAENTQQEISKAFNESNTHAKDISQSLSTALIEAIRDIEITSVLGDMFDKLLVAIPKLGQGLGDALGFLLQSIFQASTNLDISLLVANIGHTLDALRGAIYKAFSNLLDRSLLTTTFQNIDFKQAGISLGNSIYDVLETAWRSAGSLFQSSSVMNQPIFDMLFIGDTTTWQGAFDDFSYQVYARLESFANSLKDFTRGLLLESDFTEAILPTKSLLETLTRFENLQLLTRRLDNWWYNFNVSMTTGALRSLDTLTSFGEGIYDALIYSVVGVFDRMSYRNSGELFVRNMAFQFVKYSQRVKMLLSDMFRGIVTESSLEFNVALVILLRNVKAYMEGVFNGLRKFVISSDFLEFFKLFDPANLVEDLTLAFSKVDIAYIIGKAIGKGFREAGLFVSNALKSLIDSSFNSSTSIRDISKAITTFGKTIAKQVGSFFRGFYEGLTNSSEFDISKVISKSFEDISSLQFNATPFSNFINYLYTFKDLVKTFFSDFFLSIETTVTSVDVTKSFSAIFEKISTSFENIKSKLSSIDLSYFTKMLLKIKEKVPDLDAVVAYFKKFAETINRLFFEMYDKIVGHSYWPDLIDGVVAETRKLDAVLLKIKDFAGKAMTAFKEISANFVGSISLKVEELTYALGGVITAALVMSFGSPAAIAAGYLFFSGLLGNIGLQFIQKVGEPVGVVLGQMAASFTENLVSGMINAVDAIVAIVPGIFEGFARGILGIDEVEYQLLLFVTGLEAFNNSLVTTIAGLTGLLALLSSDFRKFAGSLIFGEKVRRSKSGTRIESLPVEREGGLLAYFGLSSMLDGLLATFQGNFFNIFKDKRAFAVSALAFSSAFLESVSLIEAAFLGLPALLYSVLGGDVASKIFKDFGGNLRKVVAKAFGKTDLAVSSSKGIESFVKNRDTYGQQYAEGNATLRDVLFGKDLSPLKQYKGYQSSFDFDKDYTQGDLFGNVKVASDFKPKMDKSVKDAYDNISKMFVDAKSKISAGVASAVSSAKGLFTNSFVGKSTLSMLASQITGLLTGVFLDFSGLLDSSEVASGINTLLASLGVNTSKLKTAFERVKVGFIKLFANTSVSASTLVAPVVQGSNAFLESTLTLVSSISDKLKNMVGKIASNLKGKLGYAAAAGVLIGGAFAINKLPSDLSFTEQIKVLAADVLSFFGFTFETATTLKRDLIKMASKSGSLNELAVDLNRNVKIEDSRVVVDALSSVDFANVSSRKVEGIKSFIEEINRLAATIESDKMSKGFASQVDIEEYNSKVTKLATIINKLPQEALPPVEESFKALIAEIENVDNSFSALIARAIGLSFVGDYLDRVLIKFERITQEPLSGMSRFFDAIPIGIESALVLSELYVKSAVANVKKYLKDNYSEKPTEASREVQERLKAAAGNNLQYLSYLSQPDQAAYRKLEKRAITTTSLYNEEYGRVATSTSDIKAAQRYKAEMIKAQKELEDFLLVKGKEAYASFISTTLRADVDNIGKLLKTNLGVEFDATRTAISGQQLARLKEINAEAKKIEDTLKTGVITESSRNKLLETRNKLISETKDLIKQINASDLSSFANLLKDLGGIETSVASTLRQLSSRKEIMAATTARDTSKAAFETLPLDTDPRKVRLAFDKYLADDYNAKTAIRITDDYESVSSALKNLGLDQISYAQYASMSSDRLNSFVKALNAARDASLGFERSSKSLTSTRKGVEVSYNKSVSTKDIAQNAAKSLSILKDQGLSVFEYIDSLQKKTFKDGFFGDAAARSITEYTTRLSKLQNAEAAVAELQTNRVDTPEWESSYLDAVDAVGRASQDLQSFTENSKASLKALSAATSLFGATAAEALVVNTPKVALMLKAFNLQVVEADNRLNTALSEGSVEAVSKAIQQKAIALQNQRSLLIDAIDSLVGSVVASGEYDDIVLTAGLDVVKSLVGMKADIQTIKSRLELSTDPFEIEALVYFKKESEFKDKVARELATAQSAAKGEFLTPTEKYQQLTNSGDAYASSSIIAKRAALEARRRQLMVDVASSTGTQAELTSFAEIERRLNLEKEALDRATASARDFAEIHRTAGDVLNAFSRFNLSELDITMLPSSLTSEIIALDKALQKLEVSKRSASGSLALEINSQISQLKLKEVELNYKLNTTLLQRQLSDISNVFGVTLNSFTAIALTRFSALSKNIAEAEKRFMRGDRSVDIFGMKTFGAALLQLETSLETSVRNATYKGLEGALTLWRSIGADSELFAFDTSASMSKSLSQLSELEKTIRSTSLTEAAVVMLESIDTSNISEVLTGVSDELWFLANGFGQATTGVTKAGVDAISKIKDAIKASKLNELLASGNLSVKDRVSLGADARGLALDKTGRYRELSAQRALAKSALEVGQNDPLISPDKLEALQKGYDIINNETEKHLEGINTLADFAFNSGASMRASMQNTLQTTLADVLKGTARFEEMGDILLNAFTSTVIDTFAAGVMERLMGASSPIGSALSQFGSWLASQISLMFANMQLASASSSSSSGIFGSLLNIGASYFTKGATAFGSTYGTNFLSEQSLMLASQQFATGGKVSGAGTGTSDSILAAISNGEYVVNAKATKEHLGLLNAINFGGIPAFATGGLVSTDVVQPTVGSFTPMSSTGTKESSAQVFNINITGDISRQTKSEIVKMLPEIAMGVNSHNKEKGHRR